METSALEEIKETSDDVLESSTLSTSTFVHSPKLSMISEETEVEEDDYENVHNVSKATSVASSVASEDRLRMKDFEKNLEGLTMMKLVRNALLREVYEKNYAAVVIQGCFRKFMLQKRVQRFICNKAATKIQRQWKCYQERKKFLEIKAKTILIQSYVRMFIAQMNYRALLKQREESAVLIQKCWRSHAAQNHFQTLKAKTILLQSMARMMIAKRAYQNLLKTRDQAATTIQSTWRRYSSTKKYNDLKSKTILIQSMIRMFIARKNYLLMLEKREVGAVVIQKNFRRFLAMKELVTLRNEKAARTIQAHWKGYSAKKKFLTLKSKTILIQSFVRMMIKRNSYLQIQDTRHGCATKIQSIWRGYKERQSFLLLKSQTIKLQSLARMWTARRSYQALLENRCQAATLIQKNIRMILAIRKLHSLRREKAATTIHKFWKGYIARKDFSSLRSSAIVVQSLIRMKIARKNYHKLLLKRNEAAIKIQTNFRRYVAMNELKFLRREKASIMIQSQWRCFQERKTFLDLKKKTILIQSFVKMFIAKKCFEDLICRRNQAAILIQKNLRMVIAMKKLETLRHEKAAIIIQKSWKSYKTRSEYLDARTKATLIQSMVRMMIARNKYKNTMYQRNVAAIRIQSNFRKYLAIKKLSELKQEKAATLIQTSWRSFIARKKYLNVKSKTILIQSYVHMMIAKKNYRQLLDKRQKSAIIIQKNLRMILAMNQLQCLRKNKAATMIQAVWKCYSNRRKYLETKAKIILIQSLARRMIAQKSHQNLLKKRQESAILIQCFIRRHQAMKQLRSLKTNKAALTIQKNWKAFKGRKTFLTLKSKTIVLQSFSRMIINRKAYLSLLATRESSAILIQKYTRRFLAMKTLQLLKREKAATMIQKSWKGHKERSQYLRLKSKTILIQAQVRSYLERSKYLRLVRSTLVIQKNLRMFRAKQLLRSLRQENHSALILQKHVRKYLAVQAFKRMKKEHSSAILIQKTWKMYKQRKEYLSMMKKIVKLQSIAKMILQQQKYAKMVNQRNEAAIVIQKHWKSLTEKRKYCRQKEMAVKVQAFCRGFLARKSYEKTLEKRGEAAIVIQKNWRMYSAMTLKSSLLQGRTLKLNKNATIIQNTWRMYKAKLYLESLRQMKLNESAIKIQKTWKMYKARRELCHLRSIKMNSAALTIQKNWKMFLAMKKRTDLKLVKMNQAATLIQKTYRMHLAIKSLENLKRLHIEKLEKSAITIQKFVRMCRAKNKLKKLLHEKSVKEKEIMEQKKMCQAATVIQKTWRCAVQRQSYLRTKEDIIHLQSLIRMYLARKTYQHIMENRQKAAIKIQQSWRSYSQCKRSKELEYQARNQAALKIQGAFKMLKAKQELAQLRLSNEEYLKEQAILHEQRKERAAMTLQNAFKGYQVRIWYLRHIKAATVIKAAWRGYKARKALKKAVIAIKLAEVQRRVSEALKNVTEDKKLCNRTAFALDYLFKYVDMGMLIEALNNLNVTLSYSTNCCLRMIEEDGKAIGILMQLLNGLNRSVPHTHVMSIIFDILISLAEFRETRSKLAAFDLVYASVVGAMSKVEKSSDVFGKGCSLFWRLAAEEAGKVALNKGRILKKLTEFEQTQKRRKKPPSMTDLLTKNKAKKVNPRLTTKHGCQLTESIVRHHSDSYLAITILMKRLRT